MLKPLLGWRISINQSIVSYITLIKYVSSPKYLGSLQLFVSWNNVNNDNVFWILKFRLQHMDSPTTNTNYI